MTSKLLEELKNLKKGLASIEIKVDNSTSGIIKRENIHERLEKKLVVVEDSVKNRVGINSGGKIFEITTKTLENCSYNNILKSYGNLQKDQSNNFFIDINPRIFKYFLELIRQTNNEEFDRTSTVPVKMSVSESKPVFVEELKKFFVDEDSEDLLAKFFVFKEDESKVTIPTVVVQPQPAVDPYGYGNAGPYGY